MIWSSVNVGLTAFTASFTAFCSSAVNCSGFFTLTGLGLVNVNFEVSSTTVSFWDSVPVLSPSVTTTEPSSATSIFAVSGSVGFASLTAFLTFSFSSAVNWLIFCTGVFSGATNLIVLSVSVAALTVLAAGISWVFGVSSGFFPIGTVTVPLSATWISSSLKSRSGLAALTASLTSCFSCSVSLAGFATVVISGFFNSLPALSNGFTVSLPSSLPVLVPSVTVTLPLLSTVTSASLFNLVLFASLTASATLSLSACVKSVVSFTSVFSGLFKSSTVSFCTTVCSGLNEPTLPPWLIFTDPSSFTVMSSFVKFLSGFAALIASLTACFSSGVNFVLSTTLTGSFGGLNSFWTSFCLTVLSFGIVPVFPFFVTVTVPSSATVTSASVTPLSLFASATAFLTLSISSDVNDLVSLTSTGFGSFKVKGSLLSFSQTAYTVFGASTLFKMLASASLASLLAAQPLNVYPSLVGLAGAVTLPPSTFAVVVSLPSVNLPWFASKVTATSSE